MTQRLLKLHDDWQSYQAEQDPIESIMSLTGEVFRDVPNRQTAKISHEGKSYFIKKHFGVGVKEILKNYLFLRKPVVDASNEWQALTALAHAQIKAPEVMAIGVDAAAPYRRRSFIILEDLKDRVSLEDIVLKDPDFFKSVSRRRHWIEVIAKIVKRMHDNGINHRDLYLCHFLVEPGIEHPTADDIYLIDLHRAAVRKHVPKRWLIKDLAALYFSSWPMRLSQRDKLHFIRHYSDLSLRECLTQFNTFWQQVAMRAAKMYDEFQRKYPKHDYPEL